MNELFYWAEWEDTRKLWLFTSMFFTMPNLPKSRCTVFLFRILHRYPSLTEQHEFSTTLVYSRIPSYFSNTRTERKPLKGQGARFSKAPETFPVRNSDSKISNLATTDLFSSHILNMNRGSLYTRSSRSLHVFRFFLDTGELKMALRSRKIFRGF